MAAETLSDISNALSQNFAPDLARQWNRSAVLAGLVAAAAEVMPGNGKNVAFDTEFSGASASTVAEGSDVTDGELASDVNVPAILSWAHYRSSFKVSETELDAAASSMGVASALLDLFGERIMGSGAKLSRLVNTDMWTGDGTDGSGNPQLVGFTGGALDATGTYAGILRSSYAEWAGNVLENSGTPRALTLDLMYSADQQIFVASGEQATHIVTSPGVYRKYAELFESVRRVVGDGQSAMSMGSGAASLFWKGIPVLRDPNCPAGTILFFNAPHVKAKYLPRLSDPRSAVTERMMQLEGGNGGSKLDVTRIPCRVAILAKTGDSVKASLKATIAMCVTRPNAFAVIKDVSEV